MQEFIRFLSQGWVGTTFGVVGTVVGVLSLFLYWRSQIPGIVAFQSQDVSMIGSADAVFPAEIKVLYRNTTVPRLTSSTVWFWNAGKKTVRGEDISSDDPLCLRFSGEILDVRTRTVSRDAVHVTTNTSRLKDMEDTVNVGFKFLDPGDGGVLEVLHTGSAEAPECKGTIIGLPGSPRYWGRASGHSALARRDRKILRFVFTVTLVLGLVLIATGIIGEQAIRDIFPYPSDGVETPAWLRLVVGLLGFSFSVIMVWLLGRRSPSSLDVD